MDIKIYARNLDLNPNAEDYVQKKFNRVLRHLPNMDDAKIEVSRRPSRSSGEQVHAQMTLKIGGYTLRGQESAPNVFAAVDSVTDIVDRQIRRFKGKVYRSQRGKKYRGEMRDIPVDAIMDIPESAQEEAIEDIGEVVRTKRFSMTPMSVEDAILQMEMLGHSFFLFFNTDTSEYNVVYRRDDGDYGLLEPELV